MPLVIMLWNGICIIPYISSNIKKIVEAKQILNGVTNLLGRGFYCDTQASNPDDNQNKCGQ